MKHRLKTAGRTYSRASGRHSRRAAGFTLIEITVVLAIAWMVYRRSTDLYARKHPDSRTAQRKAAKKERAR